MSDKLPHASISVWLWDDEVSLLFQTIQYSVGFNFYVDEESYCSQVVE